MYFQTITEAKTASLESSKLTDLRRIPLAIKALLVNPTYMFISIGAAADGLVIAGLSAFLPKFIQSQYKFTASLSSGIVGELVSFELVALLMRAFKLIVLGSYL